MRRGLKWLGYGLAGLAGLLVIALIVVYVASARILGRTYDVPLDSITYPADPELAADGRRLALLWGCGDCHGEDGTGRTMFEQTFVGSVTAPNLTRLLPSYSDAELDRLVRRGIRRNGTSVLVMPAEYHYHIPEPQLAAIVAYFRGLPELDGPEMGVKLGPFGRALLVAGEFRLAADHVDASSPRMPYPVPGDLYALGEYWATIGCSLCHGEDLRGAESGFAPSLEVVATSYTAAQFELFLRAGIAIDGKKRGFMSEIARGSLRHMSPDDVAGLYVYLTATLSDAGEPPD